MTMTIAMTGATGFVGGETLAQALAAGHHVHALTRRAQPPQARLTWMPGALDQGDSLDRLVAQADAVIHIAGVVNAPDRAAFEAGNATGTMALVDAMRRQGVRRLIHVSSLAAREPDLSDYGWSKELAERHVKASGLDWTIVRPPAIYGPGDREMLELFQMAKRGLVLLPPGGRFSVIHVADLARLLLALATDREISLTQCYEIDDGAPDGWDHRDFALALGRALDRRVRPVSMPRALMTMGAAIDRLVRGQRARLTPDRVRYFCHPDWVSNSRLAPPSPLWTPQVSTEEGLRTTAQAYHAKGWL